MWIGNLLVDLHSISDDDLAKQGHIQGVCLAVMTGPFLLQVLSIKADKI